MGRVSVQANAIQTDTLSVSALEIPDFSWRKTYGEF